MKDKLPQKDSGTYEQNVQLKIDGSFAEKVIPANDSVRLLDKVVEEMDIGALMRAYDAHGRKPATPPRTMLKIVLYAGKDKYTARRSKNSGQCKSKGKSKSGYVNCVTHYKCDN